MGARGTFHPFPHLLRDGPEAFGGLIVPVPTVSVVACGVAGSRTSALTLPLPEGVSSRPPPGEERRPALCSRTESRAPFKGCAPVSAKRALRPPPHPWACRRLLAAPRHLVRPGWALTLPRAPSGRSRTQRKRPQPGQRARGRCGGPRIRPRRF